MAMRYLDLVNWTAVELVEGYTHRVEDVAPIVFEDLARMARNVSGDTTLGVRPGELTSVGRRALPPLQRTRGEGLYDPRQAEVANI
jgi:hypothetical protein